MICWRIEISLLSETGLRVGDTNTRIIGGWWLGFKLYQLTYLYNILKTIFIHT